MNLRHAYITVVFSVLVLAVANCGTDTVLPADPASSLPSLIFFNTTGDTEYVALEGTASDNTSVTEVQLSFNGGSFVTAVIDPPGGASTVEWSYLAGASQLPAGANTVVIKAIDSSDNESVSSPITVDSTSGSTTASLVAALANPAYGDTVGLSTGEGFAYGDSATDLTLSPAVPVTIVGAGFGDALTSWGADPGGETTSTILESSSVSSPVFSVAADITLKGLRILGGEEAVRINLGVSGPAVMVEECVLDMQSAWGIFAADNDSGTTVEVLSSLIDASTATSSNRGGLHVTGVSYVVSGSWFVGQTDPGGPEDTAVQGAAAEVVAGTGTITDSLFDGNALAIWAIGGSPLITSCDVQGANANTSYGINLPGTGAATLRRNTVNGHSGYGVRVGGTMELYFRNNAVINNSLSGVLIDSQLSNSNLLNIDLGTVSDPGRNLFENNTHPDGNGAYDTQIYVTQATSDGSFLIPANWNYWDYFNLTDIDFSIVDDLDDGGGRAGVNIGSFYTTKGEAGP